jgi:diguanylate cyclase (GGDEF)-like protein
MLEKKVDEFVASVIENDKLDVMNHLKSKLVDFYFKVFLIFMTIPVILSVYRMVDVGWQPIFAVHIFLAFSFYVVFALRNTLHTFFKSLFLVAAFYIAGLSGLLQFSLLGNGILLFSIATILSFVLLSLRCFKVIVFLTVAAILLVGVFYPDGIIQANIDPIAYLKSPKAWLLKAFAYAMLLISTLSGVGIVFYTLEAIIDKERNQRDELRQLNERLEHLSITDKLTQTFNRIGIDNSINNELNRLKRYGQNFGIILLDVDYFKKVNDTFGHDVGDFVLKGIAEVLKKNTRATDIVGRWGGEEFLIICPETNEDNISKLAELLRTHIEQHDFNPVDKVTCSFGTTIANKDDDINSLLKKADSALYEAKESGRNKVCQSKVL